jgi:hypothetical protein
MPSEPIFIVGTERSGSNLLRLILDSHPSIVIPHPPHVMRYFTPLLPRYGDLGEDRRFEALIRDVHALVVAHIHPWPWVPEVEELRQRATQRSLIAIYRALHDAVRDHVQKARWGCKSTFMVHHLAQIASEWPGARVIWLYRDPRDVAASSRESVFSAFHPYNTAMLWVDQQGAALDAEARWPAMIHRLRYESLVAEPEAQIRDLCGFLGEEFHPPMLEWFKGDEARQSASLSESWANTAAPMRKESLQRWSRELSDDDLAAVECVAAPLMEKLGYIPAMPAEMRAPGYASGARRARWWLADRWAWAKVEGRSLRKDKNVRQRWARGALLARIRWRLAIRGY